MLFTVIKTLGRKSTKEVFKPGDLVQAEQEKAEVLVREGYLNPVGPKEAIEFLIKSWGKYPYSWLEDGYYYAFEYDPRPEVPGHLKAIIEGLKRDIAVGLDRAFYKWTKDKLELAYYLLWERGKEKIDLATLRAEDLFGGDNEFYIVTKPFEGGGRKYRPGEMILPEKKVAFPLVFQGYIRPALPVEALNYLVANTNYPATWLGVGAWYAFLYPGYPNLPPQVLEQIKNLFRDFELSYEKGLFNHCRKLLEKAKKLVWQGEYPIEGELNLPERITKIQAIAERFNATIVPTPAGLNQATTKKKIRRKHEKVQ